MPRVDRTLRPHQRQPETAQQHAGENHRAPGTAGAATAGYRTDATGTRHRRGTLPPGPADPGTAGRPDPVGAGLAREEALESAKSFSDNRISAGRSHIT